MNCEKFGEKLSAYLDGELDYETREGLENHLLECAACARQVEEMRRIESFKPLLEPPKLPREKWRECWEEIRKQTTDSISVEEVKAGVARRRRAHHLRRFLAGACAAAAAAVVLAILLWPSGPVEEFRLPPQEESVCINDYDDSRFSVYVVDKPEYTIIKLIPVATHEGG